MQPQQVVYFKCHGRQAEAGVGGELHSGCSGKGSERDVNQLLSYRCSCGLHLQMISIAAGENSPCRRLRTFPESTRAFSLMHFSNTVAASSGMCSFTTWRRKEQNEKKQTTQKIFPHGGVLFLLLTPMLERLGQKEIRDRDRDGF